MTKIKQLANVKELASFLRCTTDSVYRNVADNKLSHLKYGGIIRFDPDQYPGLEEHMKANKVLKEKTSTK